MITRTAGAERQTGGWQRKWVRWTGSLAIGLFTLGALALLAALLTATLSRVWGYQSYVVHGSSMEPSIQIGSVILTKPTNVDDLQVGDMIVFGSPGNGVTLIHRIAGVREEDGQRYFQTKADAPDALDPQELEAEGQLYKFAYQLPYLGYLVHFAKSALGILLLLVLPAVGLEVVSLTKDSRPEGKDVEMAEVPPES